MRTSIYLILLLSIIAFSSCKKEKTVWDSEWGAPIINDTLTLQNLVDDSIVVENGMGYYDLDFEKVIELNVNDSITIPDTTINEKYTIALLNLTLNPGFSFINNVEEHDLNMPYGIRLGKIILKEGAINVKVYNPIGTKAFFNVLLPGVSKDGIQFNQQYEAPPGTNQNPGVISASIDLSGYEVDLTGVTGSEWNKFRSIVSVSTDPNGPTVVITNQDTTKVEASFSGFKLDYARGYFGDAEFSGDQTFTIDALNNYYGGGLFDIPSTTVTMELENSIKVSAQGKIDHLTNTNNQGSVVDFNHPQIGTEFYINAATGSWNNLVPSLKTFQFTSANSNLEAYVENLGHEHSLGFSIKLNPWGNVSGGWDELYPNSDIKLKLKVNMPLLYGLNDLIVQDTFEVNLNQEPDKTKVISGELIMDASNAFPYGAVAEIYLLNANKNVLHTISSPNGIESALYGSIDPESGLMVKKSQARFILTEEALADINQVKYILVRTVLNSPNPSSGVSEPQSIPIGAFIGVQIRTKFKTENQF